MCLDSVMSRWWTAQLVCLVLMAAMFGGAGALGAWGPQEVSRPDRPAVSTISSNAASVGTANLTWTEPNRRLVKTTSQLEKPSARLSAGHKLAENKTLWDSFPEDDLAPGVELPIPKASGSNKTLMINNTGRSFNDKIFLPVEHSQDGYRPRRSTSDECQVTKDTFVQLQSTLQNIRVQLGSNSAQSSRNPNKFAGNCQQTIANIKETAKELTGMYSTLINNPPTDVRYNALKIAYKAEIETLDKKLSSIKEEIGLQYKPLIGAVIANIYDVKKKLSDASQISINLQAMYEKYEGLGLYCTRDYTDTTSACCGVADFSRPTECILSVADLIQIHDMLLKITTVTLVHSTDAKLYTPSSYNCVKSMPRIMETLDELKRIFNDVTSPRSMETRYGNLNRTHETDIARKNKLIDDSRQMITQRLELNYTTLQQELQELSSKLTSVLEHNIDLQEMQKAEAIRYCASLIRCGDFNLAKLELSELNDDQKLLDIVKGAYANNLDNAENILTFIRSLEYFKQDAKAYPALFEEMKRNNHLGSPQALRLVCQVDEVMKMPNYSNISQGDKARFVTLKNALVSTAQSIIESWASRIRNGDYEQAQEYANQLMNTAENANIFNDIYLPQIIVKAYANDIKNVDNILVFVRRLRWLSQLGRGYTHVFNEMKSRNHLDNPQIIELAYYVNEAMSINNYDHVKEESKHFFENIKSQLPSGIRRLLWDPYVVITSRKYPSYTLYGSAPGNIYSYPDNNYEYGWNQKWTVDTKDLGKNFRFINIQNDQSFYADDEGHAYGDYAKDDDMRQYWQVIPIESGKYPYFKNSANGRILDVNDIYSCASSRLCCCSTVHAVSSYTGTYNQHWEIN